MRLLLLLLPLGLFADVVNLKCDYESTLDVKEMKTSSTTGTFSVKINAKDKLVAVDQVEFQRYKEQGTTIYFQTFSGSNDLQIIYAYSIDRVTGYSEVGFYTWAINESDLDPADILKLYDRENYDLGLVHSAQCKPVKPLF